MIHHLWSILGPSINLRARTSTLRGGWDMTARDFARDKREAFRLKPPRSKSISVAIYLGAALTHSRFLTIVAVIRYGLSFLLRPYSQSSQFGRDASSPAHIHDLITCAVTRSRRGRIRLSRRIELIELIDSRKGQYIRGTATRAAASDP
jgi:hypothetical protein